MCASRNDPDSRELPAAVQRAEELCQQFREQWNALRRPLLEQYLELVAVSERVRLFTVLLMTELEWRHGQGEYPEAGEYLERFPEYQREVREAFNGLSADDTVETIDAKETTNALRVRCPHCHNTVEFIDNTQVSEVICTTCGSRFTLVGEESSATRSVGDAGGARRWVGHFELLEQLGFGTFGAVWRARDTKLDRIVAVKIPRKISLDREETEAFLREARAAAQLSHPHIVSVHEVGIDDQLLYIVNDLVDGLTLSDVLTGRRFSIAESVELCSKIAEALEYAHDNGIVHRDLKPSNIILDKSGEPHLMDFGLAKREKGEVTVTLDGQPLGTPAYMSPEQATGKGHQADRRSDIYSLGVILFKLLTGELPFRGNVRMMLKQVIEDEAPSPRKLNNRVPRDLETVCLKCLEKNRAKRYGSAHELGVELRRFLNGEPVKARPVGAVGRMWRWYRRNPDSSTQVAGVYTVLCAVLLTAWGIEGLFVYGLKIDRSPDAATAMNEITALLISVYLPLLGAGCFIIRGRLLALAAGFLMFSVGFVLVCLGLAGVLQYAGVFNEPRLRLGILLLLGNLLFVGVLVNSAALLCHYVARPYRQQDT